MSKHVTANSGLKVLLEILDKTYGRQHADSVACDDVIREMGANCAS